MKKLLFLFALVAFTMAASAQVINLKSQYGNVNDTVTNAATKYLVSGAIPGKVSAFTVQFDAVEISDTTGGTITLQYSLDGTTYFSLAADSVYTALDVATQTFGWFAKCPAPVKYIRVRYVGTGTMATRFYAKAWGQ